MSWLKKLADDFSDQLAYRQIALNINEKASLNIKMNPTLGAVLVTNLIKNAIIHNNTNELINVLVEDNSLTIQNTGQNEALDEQNLFKRFGKKHQSEHSTGLGLAIVKAISDHYSFNITYSFNSLHSITINF